MTYRDRHEVNDERSRNRRDIVNSWIHEYDPTFFRDYLLYFRRVDSTSRLPREIFTVVVEFYQHRLAG